MKDLLSLNKILHVHNVLRMISHVLVVHNFIILTMVGLNVFLVWKDARNVIVAQNLV